MCFMSPRPQVVYQQPPPPPKKTSADIQRAEERRRLSLGISQRGLAATILTSGLGDPSPSQTGGVNLGGS